MIRNLADETIAFIEDLVDVAGIEPATPCLQTRVNLNLSRRFGCAYHLLANLVCSKVAPNHSAQLVHTVPARLHSLDSTWRTASMSRSLTEQTPALQARSGTPTTPSFAFGS
jgi:hypothetical protein